MVQQAPTLSAPIETGAAERGLPGFGYSWQERVSDIRGYKMSTITVKSRATIATVNNLSATEVIESDQWHLSGRTHAFLLLPTEHVETVEVFHLSGHGIVGLRFHTNKRVSEWFGSCVGSRTWLRAPEGQCITALYGDVNEGPSTLGHWCVRMGAIYASSPAPTDAGKPSQQRDAARSAIVGGSDSPHRAFEAYSVAPRAIVVVADSHCMQNITVVSEDEYGAYAALDGCIGSSWEHWFVLSEDERIEAVGVGMQGCRVRKLCFRTNYRTSPWFGWSAVDEVTWLDCADHPGAFICGFQVEQTLHTDLTGVGVIYSHAAKAVGKKMGAAVTQEVPRVEQVASSSCCFWRC